MSVLELEPTLEKKTLKEPPEKALYWCQALALRGPDCFKNAGRIQPATAIHSANALEVTS